MGYNFKIDITVVGSRGFDWFYLAQYSVQRRASINPNEFLVSIKDEFFLDLLICYPFLNNHSGHGIS
jgi:hypothetical protein